MIKKAITGIITNSLVGAIIAFGFGNRIPNIRYRKFRFEFPPGFKNNTLKAYLFWGLYESAELRLLTKYLDSNFDIIELGSSIGVVATHAASRLDMDRKLISVEANPNLLTTIKNNVARNNPKFKNHKVLHVAIKYNAEEVSFGVSVNTTASKINDGVDSTSDVTVKAVSLSDISKELKQFTLICDIEGAEVEILTFDKDALNRCRHLFIELHKTDFGKKEYSVEDLNRILLTDHHFNLVERDGNVFYYKR